MEQQVLATTSELSLNAAKCAKKCSCVSFGAMQDENCVKAKPKRRRQKSANMNSNKAKTSLLLSSETSPIITKSDMLLPVGRCARSPPTTMSIAGTQVNEPSDLPVECRRHCNGRHYDGRRNRLTRITQKSAKTKHNPSTISLLAILSLFYLFATLLMIATTPSEAQFLFTYEINQDSDDNRTPKSSLFDPSSFKIVTPSQLQNSYQKLSSQPPERVPTSASTDPISSAPQQTNEPQPAATGASAPIDSSGTDTAQLGADGLPAPLQSQSLFKPAQPSPALNSFADLFNSLSPSSSSASTASSLTATNRIDQQQPSSAQIEARSLHEQWVAQQQQHQQQQQQQQQPQSALQSFVSTTTPTSGLQSHFRPPNLAHPTHQQPQQPQPQNHNHHHQQQQPQPQQAASYWLTASPLNAPDGNYLVEIKQPSSQPQPQNAPQSQPTAQLSHSQQTLPAPQSQVHHNQPAYTLQRPTQPLPSVPLRARFAQAPPATAPAPQQQVSPAQSSFLATPTSYYPLPSSVPATAPLAPRQQRESGNDNHHRAPVASAPALQLDQPQQLRPPANAPEGYSTSSMNGGPSTVSSEGPRVASAEEALIAFRSQQQQQQSAEQRPPHRSQHYVLEPSLTGSEYHSQQQQQQQQRSRATGNQYHNQRPTAPTHSLAPTTTTVAPRVHHAYGEIPKVSPQIYESFLLQQKDQHEKHMELLKQQQELNLLLEKQRAKQAAEAERSNKRRKQSTEAARAQRLAAEEEAAAQKRKKDREEAELARRAAAEAAAEEAQRRRRLEEEQQVRERQAAAAKRRAEEEERARRDEELRYKEFVLRQQRARERDEEEARERKRQREAADKVRAYLRQQDELRKLLELKQAEDEAIQARRRQHAATIQATSAQVNPTTTTTTSKPLVADRQSGSGGAGSGRLQSQQTRASSWGAPIRATRVSQHIATQSPPTTSNSNQWHAQQVGAHQHHQTPASSSTTATTSTSTAAAFSPTTTLPSTTAPSSQLDQQVQPQRSTQRQRQVVAVVAKRHRSNGAATSGSLGADSEKLIRQKIPLYSGAGKYGLYRSGNDSLDLAALLESVTLPPTSTTTTTTTTTTTSPATMTTTTLAPPTSSAATSSDWLGGSSSLSPLLARAHSTSGPSSSSYSNDVVEDSAPTLFDDDDVPRRPVAPARSASSLSFNNRLNAASESLAQQVSSTTAASMVLRRLGGGERSNASFNALHRTGLQAPSTSARGSATSGRSGRTSAHGQLTASATTTSSHIGLASLPPDSDNDGIPGRAGVEYPVLASVPQTSFSCAKQPLNGYYADTETACQVVHLCQSGAQSSILCPNGTIFNQEKFSCQWWYEVDCSRAPVFYQLNDNLYKATRNATSAAQPSPTHPAAQQLPSGAPPKNRPLAAIIEQSSKALSPKQLDSFLAALALLESAQNQPNKQQPTTSTTDNNELAASASQPISETKQSSGRMDASQR